LRLLVQPSRDTVAEDAAEAGRRLELITGEWASRTFVWGAIFYGLIGFAAGCVAGTIIAVEMLAK
jgi:hypothetical protein